MGSYSSIPPSNQDSLTRCVLLLCLRTLRPELLHDAESGLPVALISGVQGPAGEWSGDQTFTLIQEVDTS